MAFPIHPRTGLTAIGIVGGRPVWPIQGGAPDDPIPTPDPAPTPPPADDGEGFPKGTPVADMKPEEQAAYWRAESKKQQRIAEERKDYETIRRERDALKAKTQTAEEAALEAARNEGRLSARSEVNNEAATYLVKAALSLRGFDEDRVSSTVTYLNPGAFVTDGSVDVAKIEAYVAMIAGPAAGLQTRNPDFGAGNRGTAPRVTGSAAGLAEAERRGFVKAKN